MFVVPEEVQRYLSYTFFSLEFKVNGENIWGFFSGKNNTPLL